VASKRTPPKYNAPPLRSRDRNLRTRVLPVAEELQPPQPPPGVHQVEQPITHDLALDPMERQTPSFSMPPSKPGIAIPAPLSPPVPKASEPPRLGGARTESVRDDRDVDDLQASPSNMVVSHTCPRARKPPRHQHGRAA